MVAMGLWGLCLTPNKPFTGRLAEAVQVTNVALMDQLQDLESRTSVRITVTADNQYESSFVLCSLTPGKVEQCTVNITLHTDAMYTLEANGPNTVYVYGNYLDEFAIIRSLRDVLKPAVLEAHQTARSADQAVVRPVEPASPSGAVDPVSPQQTPGPESVRKRRRTNDGGGDAVTAETVTKEATRSREVEHSLAPGAKDIQWLDYGAPGKGDVAIKWGDEVSLKYKMVVSSNGAPVSDNVQGKPLRFVVGDMTTHIPQPVHYALIGMKLKAQRIIKVPLASAQRDTGLNVFLKPAQAFRVDILVVEFTPGRAMASKA